MFDFGVLISLLCTIVIFYFTLTLPIKEKIKEIQNDYHSCKSDDEKKNYVRIINAKKLSIKRIFNISFALILVVLLLYLQPYWHLLKDTARLDFSTVTDLFSQLLAIDKCDFSNSFFKFSYITEVILMIILLLLFCIICYSDCILTQDYISITVIAVAILIGLCWLNYFTSMFLSLCIIRYFEFLSIVLNLLLYAIIFVILAFFIFKILDI